MAKKPVKAVAKKKKPLTARQKAVMASKNVGTGVVSKGVSAISKARKARQKMLKEMG